MKLFWQEWTLIIWTKILIAAFRTWSSPRSLQWECGYLFSRGLLVLPCWNKFLLRLFWFSFLGLIWDSWFTFRQTYIGTYFSCFYSWLYSYCFNFRWNCLHCFCYCNHDDGGPLSHLQKWRRPTVWVWCSIWGDLQLVCWGGCFINRTLKEGLAFSACVSCRWVIFFYPKSACP